MADDTLPYPTARTLALPGRGPGRMAYLDFGRGDRAVDVVFLHANGFNALTYRHVLAPLASRYRILAVDQRGHGGTTLETIVEGRRNWLDLRDDLLACLDALGLSSVVLAGHSMGATVSLLAAAAEPTSCRRLVLFDPVMPPVRAWPASEEAGLVGAAGRRRAKFGSRAEALASYRGRGAFRTWPEPMLVDYAEAGFRDLPDGTVTLACAPAWEASGYAAQEHDSWDALRRSRCPVDIVQAETASTFHAGEDLKNLSHRVRIETVPGASHFLPMERPDIVQSRLTNAIQATILAEPGGSSDPRESASGLKWVRTQPG